MKVDRPNNNITHFPRQKISTSKKTEKWAKDCIDAGNCWQPNKDAACFDCDAPSDLSLNYCPQCCNGTDDDGDGATDYPADKQCTCGLDPSEAEPLLPIPEASSIVLVGIGLLGLIVMMCWWREE